MSPTMLFKFASRVSSLLVTDIIDILQCIPDHQQEILNNNNNKEIKQTCYWAGKDTYCMRVIHPLHIKATVPDQTTTRHAMCQWQLIRNTTHFTHLSPSIKLSHGTKLLLLLDQTVKTLVQLEIFKLKNFIFCLFSVLLCHTQARDGKPRYLGNSAFSNPKTWAI